MADLKHFSLKDKLIRYTKVFVELYNWRNYEQVYKIYRMIKIKKIRILTIENFCNIDDF